MSKNTRYKLDPRELRDIATDKKSRPFEGESLSAQKQLVNPPNRTEAPGGLGASESPGPSPFDMDTKGDIDVNSTQQNAGNTEPDPPIQTKYSYKLRVNSIRGGAEIGLPRGMKEAKILQKLPHVDVCDLMSLVGDQGNYQRLIALNAVLVLFSASFAI